MFEPHELDELDEKVVKLIKKYPPDVRMGVMLKNLYIAMFEVYGSNPTLLLEKWDTMRDRIPELAKAANRERIQ